MDDLEPDTITGLQGDVGRAVCRRLWPDAQCNFESDGPCGRCGPAAQAAVKALLSIHNPGAVKAAAHQLRSFRRD